MTLFHLCFSSNPQNLTVSSHWPQGPVCSKWTIPCLPRKGNTALSISDSFLRLLCPWSFQLNERIDIGVGNLGSLAPLYIFYGGLCCSLGFLMELMYTVDSHGFMLTHAYPSSTEHRLAQAFSNILTLSVEGQTDSWLLYSHTWWGFLTTPGGTPCLSVPVLPCGMHQDLMSCFPQTRREVLFPHSQQTVEESHLRPWQWASQVCLQHLL